MCSVTRDLEGQEGGHRGTPIAVGEISQMSSGADDF